MTVTMLDPALSPAETTAAMALARATPLQTYVTGPLEDALGPGLTRRHDALLRFVQSADPADLDLGVLAHRSNLFRRSWAERGAVVEPGAAALFGHPAYLGAVREQTGAERVEPTMLYVNVMLPGQHLLWHADTPEFVGLDKLDAPEWFLVCMLHSGLFDEERVPVVGVVTFLGPVPGGSLRWVDDTGAVGAAQPNLGNAVVFDADRHLHSVARVGGQDAPAPPVPPHATLHPVPAGWRLDNGNSEVVFGVDAVRVSTQWKARCPTGAERPITREAALDRLLEALADGGVAVPADPTERAVALMDRFVPTVPQM